MFAVTVVDGKLRALCPRCQPGERDSSRWLGTIENASDGIARLTCSGCGVLDVAELASLDVAHTAAAAEQLDKVESACGDVHPTVGDAHDSETTIADSVDEDAPQSRLVLPFGYSGLELVQTDFPPPRWAISGLVPQGLTILAGRPKTGKSWLTLGWAIAIAQSTRAMGSIDVTAGDVLLLAMEDTLPRLQSRVRRLVDTADVSGLARLHTYTAASDWSRLHEGGLDMLRKWLGAHPDGRLVLVDTFARNGPPTSRRKQDTATIELVETLKQIADTYAVGIVLVDHVTKRDCNDLVYAVAGSYSYMAIADAVLVLQRKRQADQATLYATGRDVDEAEHALLWDESQGGWSLANDTQASREQTPAAWLREFLANGKRLAVEIYAAAKEKGWSNDKIKRARTQLGSVHVKRENSRSWWSLYKVQTDIQRATDAKDVTAA
jgi:hypothetical protein